MENELDDIAANKREWPSVIQDFYQPMDKDLKKAVELAEKIKLEDEKTGDDCPKCGKPLVIKSGRFGKFIACSGYPDCKYTQSFQFKVGVNCPECGNELLQRVNKKKRTFYGCSNYPECKFATNYKPLPKPCPKCSGLLTQRGQQARCIKCDHREKLAQNDSNEK